jgi:hypothetical protein
MNWFDRNILYITFGFLASTILFQMWYITKIKSELKLFSEKEHIVITHVEILGNKYSDLTDTIKIKCNDTTSKKVIRKQYSERGVLNW